MTPEEIKRMNKQDRINYLKNLYNINNFSDSENPISVYDDFVNPENNLSDDDIYYYSNSPSYVYSTLKNGPTITEYAPLILNTYYPYVHEWYDDKKDQNTAWTGHSELLVPHNYSIGLTDTGYDVITKFGQDSDYNLVTNNCSDETRRALEAVYGKKLNSILFTTPGDVRDFAIENGGISRDQHDRRIIIPMDQNKYKNLRKYLHIE